MMFNQVREIARDVDPYSKLAASIGECHFFHLHLIM